MNRLYRVTINRMGRKETFYRLGTYEQARKFALSRAYPGVWDWDIEPQ